METLANTSDTAEGDAFLVFLNLSGESCRTSDRGGWYCGVLLGLFAVALPVGILGNAAVLLHYSCLGKALTASGVFLLNLALCDSAWILTLPFSLYFRLWTRGAAAARLFCRVRRLSFNVNVYGSILFLTLVSFDRYVGAVHPVRSLRWWGAGRAKLCSAGAWAGLVIGSVPDLFVTFSSARRPENLDVCLDHVKGPFLYVGVSTVLRTALGFLLPLAALMAFYVRTACVLRRLKGGKRVGGAKRGGRKPLRLLTASVLLFLVSFVPYHVMVVALMVMVTHNMVTASNAEGLYVSYELCEAVCVLSSCLDPLLYILASGQFKRKLLALKRDRCRRLCSRANGRVGVIGE
ncbi:lysophosphatidic acid receptor 6-like isoform 1-T1 [Menidia menidia]